MTTKKKTAQEIMNIGMLTVGPTDPIEGLAALMRANHAHYVFVVLHNKLIGIISERDLLRLTSDELQRASFARRDLESLEKMTSAQEIMSNPVISCLPTERVETAAAKMFIDDIGCLPVVDEHNLLVGYLDARGLLLELVGPDVFYERALPSSEPLTAQG